MLFVSLQRRVPLCTTLPQCRLTWKPSLLQAFTPNPPTPPPRSTPPPTDPTKCSTRRRAVSHAPASHVSFKFNMSRVCRRNNVGRKQHSDVLSADGEQLLFEATTLSKHSTNCVILYWLLLLFQGTSKLEVVEWLTSLARSRSFPVRERVPSPCWYFPSLNRLS